MTIVADIAAAIREAELEANGISFGWSGWHAWHADCVRIRLHGDATDRNDLRLCLPLARFRTGEFQGWELMLRPSTPRGYGREAA